MYGKCYQKLNHQQKENPIHIARVRGSSSCRKVGHPSHWMELQVLSGVWGLGQGVDLLPVEGVVREAMVRDVLAWLACLRGS